MIRNFLFGALILISMSAAAQVQTQVIGDSVHMRSNASTAELILENSTKNVKGFLFNKGNGRTEFRKGLVKVNDSLYILGDDSLNVSTFASGNLWKLIGNAASDPETNFIGTLDDNPFRIRTNNIQRASVLSDGTFNVAYSDTAPHPLFRVYPNGDFSAQSKNDMRGNLGDNGIRYSSKYGIFEIGTANNFDTTLNVSCCGSPRKSALVINSDEVNTINGEIHGSIISGDNMFIDTSVTMAWSAMIGERHVLRGDLTKGLVVGYRHGIDTGSSFFNSLVTGYENYFGKNISYSLVNGFGNATADTTAYSLVSGRSNRYGGYGQLLSGNALVNKTPWGTVLGNSNVDFPSLSYTGNRGLTYLSTIPNLNKYPIFSIGNSNNVDTSHKSNALTILYNGRTQINTTGFSNDLGESDVVPKAALEIVSNNSGILIPRLTNAQRDSIVSDDRHNGLLLYNTDSTKFQFYNGSSWSSLADNNSTGVNASILSLTDGSTITWDAASTINSMVILRGTNRTLTISNPVAGRTYKIIIRQDSTGNRQITTWPTGVLWESGAPPDLSPAPLAIDIVTFYYDGTNFFGQYRLEYKAVANVSINAHDAKNDDYETFHVFTDVPAGALLVVTTASESSLGNADVSSTPSLTWVKQADASAINRGDAEIYTAVYAAGGSITVRSSWDAYYQSSVCYVIEHQEPTLGGATATQTTGTTPEVAISTTRGNSILIAVSSDWSAQNGSSRSYRESATETKYQRDVGAGTAYHYYVQATSIAGHTMGLTAPGSQASGTAVLEVRGR